MCCMLGLGVSFYNEEARGKTGSHEGERFVCATALLINVCSLGFLPSIYKCLEMECTNKVDATR